MALNKILEDFYATVRKKNGKKKTVSCLSEIFVRIFYTSNYMIFLVQFGMNKHLRARAILLVFEKFNHSYLIQIALEIM